MQIPPPPSLEADIELLKEDEKITRIDPSNEQGKEAVEQQARKLEQMASGLVKFAATLAELRIYLGECIVYRVNAKDKTIFADIREILKQSQEGSFSIPNETRIAASSVDSCILTYFEERGQCPVPEEEMIQKAEGMLKKMLYEIVVSESQLSPEEIQRGVRVITGAILLNDPSADIELDGMKGLGDPEGSEDIHELLNCFIDETLNNGGQKIIVTRLVEINALLTLLKEQPETILLDLQDNKHYKGLVTGIERDNDEREAATEAFRNLLLKLKKIVTLDKGFVIEQVKENIFD